jgi:hypothetical protein
MTVNNDRDACIHDALMTDDVDMAQAAGGCLLNPNESTYPAFYMSHRVFIFTAPNRSNRREACTLNGELYELLITTSKAQDKNLTEAVFIPFVVIADPRES